MKMSKVLVAVAGLVSIVVTAGCSSQPSAASASECEKVQKWVQANAKRLPHSYSELTEYPTAYRRAIYATYSPDERSAVWQGHFDAYLMQHPELGQEQVDYLRRAKELATPAFFANAKLKESRAQLESLRTGLETLFGSDEAFNILAQLGPSDDSLISTLYGGGGGGGNCSCSLSSDWCGGSSHCASGGCTNVEDECGTLWTYLCNGNCHPNT
ncbi:bacteriocin fulvocin C-related protein [Corallococcus sp. AS-1-6]|uniref:bacteriocin fulvocin C-related protein n=1 Tax=Corallococcus sp. AS-1-6 TaxID=2874599 RepID=UPI001CBC3179|nr:bacteriocin fulvocin C-related protein [Corallococcus sp. AS-1-6]MBZ4373864.1 bacteriocin fulvocin C-related protein [Corallococcus sp. AS-1-6]